MTGTALIERIEAVVGAAARVTVGTELGREIEDVAGRLRRPLRVAIAGRTKAGKSTLLNALVGERLAATDATECTRIVTWYRYDLGYKVEAVLRSGERRSLEFDRTDGLDIRLGGVALAEIERLEVGWPSSRLLDLTLIDTPGLDTEASDGSERTMDALVGDEGDAGEADAVIYLMRHLHRRDAEFLDAFDAAGGAWTSPVNAVALLSRADEIGAGRADALESSARVAKRYATEPRLATLAMAVLPVAGLLAETGTTLRETEVADVRAIAALDSVTVELLLLSVDRFRSRDENPLPPDAREGLLSRLGLFGLRLAVGALRERPDLSGPDVSRLLVERSGIRAVEALLRRHFADRADALKARSALQRLRSVAARAGAAGLDGATEVAVAVEREEAGAPELGQLRLLHLVHARLAELSDEERIEIDRLLRRGSVSERVGAATDAATTEVRAVTLAAIERWRRRAGNPLVDRRTAEAAEGVARAYEGVFADLEAINATA
jgi:hypothetical protein